MLIYCSFKLLIFYSLLCSSVALAWGLHYAEGALARSAVQWWRAGGGGGGGGTGPRVCSSHSVGALCCRVDPREPPSDLSRFSTY